MQARHRPTIVSKSAVDCLERLISEMTYYVSSDTLNPAHSLTHFSSRRLSWYTETAVTMYYCRLVRPCLLLSCINHVYSCLLPTKRTLIPKLLVAPVTWYWFTRRGNTRSSWRRQPRECHCLIIYRVVVYKTSSVYTLDTSSGRK